MLLLRPTSALVAACVALSLAACSGAPAKADRASAAPDEAASSASAANGGAQRNESVTGSGSAVPAGAAGASGSVAGAPGTSAGGTASPPAQPAVPKRALADFDRAVGLMKAGNSGEAELEFKTLAAGYPQLAAAQINLALLQRKASRLDEAE